MCYEIPANPLLLSKLLRDSQQQTFVSVNQFLITVYNATLYLDETNDDPIDYITFKEEKYKTLFLLHYSNYIC